MADLDRQGCWSRRRAWALSSCRLPEMWRRWLAATWLFCDAHLEQLRSFADIDRDQLICFFTLTPADVAFIDPGRGRGPADRLGLAAQLSTLPWLGFVRSG